ncbi:MAG TPA: T9SS type A sorting domain-containing protein [Bacteroidales bacterium]|nr:T9SS type A sorting domain-containing protein [Bacteroidales bacterium]
MKKSLLLFAFQALCIYAFAQNTIYINEGFSTVPPTGWTIDAQSSNWSAVATTNAGGTSPEAEFYYDPTFNSTSRLISPVVNTTGVTHLMLGFNHALSHYSGNYTIGVATRSNAGTWHTVWSIVNPTTDITATAVGVDITNADLGSSTFQFCFFFTGNSYNLNSWWIDNAMLYEPCSIDAKMAVNSVPLYITSGNNSVTGTVKNFGYTAITGMTINYKTGASGSTQSTVLTGLNIAPGANYDFTCTQPWAATSGTFIVKTWISDVNSAGADCNQTNDSITKTIGVATQTTTRRPVYEEFTSSTCSPCASFNTSTFTPFITSYGTQFSYIKYQMNWPAATGFANGDPYYTAEGGTRRAFYGVSGVPDLYVDGRASGMSSTTMLSELNTDKAKATFFVIQGLNPGRSGNIVTIPLTITPYVSGSFKVHVVVVEKTTTGNVASNGETSFKHVMMDMLTGGSGLTVNLTAGTDYTNTFTQDLTSTFVEEMTDLQVVVMIQETTTKEIYQSAESDISFITNIDANTNDNISVFPNPANDYITITNALNSDIMVYDIFGKLVMSEHNNDNNFQLNVSELAKGNYIMKIINGSNISTRKITVLK